MRCRAQAHLEHHLVGEDGARREQLGHHDGEALIAVQLGLRLLLRLVRRWRHQNQLHTRTTHQVEAAGSQCKVSVQYSESVCELIYANAYLSNSQTCCTRISQYRSPTPVDGDYKPPSAAILPRNRPLVPRTRPARLWRLHQQVENASTCEAQSVVDAWRLGGRARVISANRVRAAGHLREL